MLPIFAGDRSMLVVEIVSRPTLRSIFNSSCTFHLEVRYTQQNPSYNGGVALQVSTS